jgi:Fe-S-cluster containining protein
MDFDFTPYFKRYEELLKIADQLFDRMAKQYPVNVKCREGCADCCHALFDLTIIEALYINHQFGRHIEGAQREEILSKANQIDRLINRIKRKAFKELNDGKDENEILAEMALERARCPLLDSDDRCALYLYRPITCRFYGIPTEIGGKAHTCGLSGFVEGEQYPTVRLDKIHQQLQQITAELVRDLGSRYIKLADMLVPLSMALLTVYDEYYFGLKEPEEEKPVRKKKRRRTRKK